MKIEFQKYQYTIRFAQFEEASEIVTVQVTCPLLNGRATSLEIGIDPTNGSVSQIRTEHVLPEDVQTLGDYEWKAFLSEQTKHEESRQVAFFWQADNWTVVACVPGTPKSLLSNQLYAHMEGFKLRHTDLDPTYLSELPLLFADLEQANVHIQTFSQFLEVGQNEHLTGEARGIAYARAYQKWRTLSYYCHTNNIRIEQYRTGLEGRILPAFKEEDYIIERKDIDRQLYLGSEYENQHILLCTFHSHNPSQEEVADLILFSLIRNGYLISQWTAYLNPLNDFTPQVVFGILDHLNSYLIEQTPDFRLSYKMQPIRSSKESGQYLLPTLL